MSFEINPCQAALDQFGPCDVNNINNKCFETCAAFQGAQSLNGMYNSDCFSNCKKCVNSVIASQGKDVCENQLEPSPIFNQTPHFLPKLLQGTGNLKESLNLCYNMCNSTRTPETCKQNCLFDAKSVVGPVSVENFDAGVSGATGATGATGSPPVTFNSFAQSQPWAFYITFGIVAVLLAIILIIFIRSLVDI